MNKINRMESEAIQSLLKIAQSDLRASKLLYKNKLYLQAIFSFQQFVEKANKAFAQRGYFYSLETMKKLGHGQEKLLMGMLNQHADEIRRVNEGQQNAPQFFQLLKECNIDFSGYEDEIKNFPKYIESIKTATEFSKVTTRQLNEIIDGIHFNFVDLEKLLKSPSFRKAIRANSFQILDKLVQTELFQNHMEEFKTMTKDDSEILLNIMDVIVTRSLAAGMTAYCIQLMGFVFSPLVSKVRYPEIIDENLFDPTVVFTGKHPMVRKLPEFHQLAKKAMKYLKELFS